MRIAKICPPYIWRPDYLVQMICSPEPCFLLIRCLQVALSILSPDHVGGQITHESCPDLLISSDDSTEFSSIGGKRRPSEDGQGFNVKRQKVDHTSEAPASKILAEHKAIHLASCESERGYAYYVHTLIVSLLDLLKSPAVKPGSLEPNVALRALSMLSIAFCRVPKTSLSLSTFRQMISWIPWIFDEVG